MALAVVSRELTVPLELSSELVILASGQPSFLVQRKSAILCGRALFSPCSRAVLPPTVLYFPHPCFIFPNWM